MNPVVVSTATVRIPSGYRGVLLTWGKVEDRVLTEGLNFKIPFSQSVVLMNTQIQKAESTEATATADLQEVSTTVAVNYRLNPLKVNDVYTDLRQDYVNRVIKPNIEESIKATTAAFRAEELITNRAAVKSTLDEILTEDPSKAPGSRRQSRSSAPIPDPQRYRSSSRTAAMNPRGCARAD